MALVSGFGGVFLRSGDPATLYKGLGTASWTQQDRRGAYAFPAPDERWPDRLLLLQASQHMIPPSTESNDRPQVDDVDGLLDCLQAQGAAINPDTRATILAPHTPRNPSRNRPPFPPPPSPTP